LDAFGDTLAALDRAGTNADGQKYRVSGAHTRYQGTGRIATVYRPFFFTGDGSTFPADSYAYGGPTELFAYDALGRMLQSRDFNQHSTLFRYHPSTLSTDIIDPEQDFRQLGGHQGAFTTVTFDGHGRTTQTLSHLVSGPSSGNLITATAYQPTGEPISITQTFPGGTYSRSMAYDSLGRLVLNQEPNSGTWTYAYNDRGELVGTSDARGCGENIFHDNLGRVVAEDYSPCDTSSQPPYTNPNLTTGDRTEVFNVYDPTTGLLTDTFDRAQHTKYAYDQRGRPSKLTRRIATPTGDDLFANRYAQQTFIKTLGYDAADRLTGTTTGADAPELQSVSEVDSVLSYEGAIAAVTTGTGQALVTKQTVDETAAITQQVFGDAAATTADMQYYPNGSLFTYHLHRGAGPWATSASYQPPSSTDPNTKVLQAELTNLQVTYDKVNNPTIVTDAVGPSTDWPDGMKPQATQSLSYYDDYRLLQVQTSYLGDGQLNAADSFSWPPYKNEQATGDDTYPAATLPAPANRVRQQNFSYDWLGNTTSTTDDQGMFLDRSLGTVTNGATVGDPPHRLQRAVSPNASRSLQVSYDAAGHVMSWTVYKGQPPAQITPTLAISLPQWTTGATYQLGQQVQFDGKPYQCMQPSCPAQTGWEPGAPGLTALWQGVAPTGVNPWDPGSVAYSRGDLVTYGGQTYECIGANASQPAWAPGLAQTLWQPLDSSSAGPVLQVYQYTWDELGRLASASRQDAGDPNGIAETFAYDSGGRRVRTARQDTTTPADQAEHTVEVFASMVLQKSKFENGNYDANAATEHAYLDLGTTFAHAFYAEDSLPTASSGKLHIFYALGDSLGSTSFIIDHDTGELVERATYMAFGAPESDYRPQRWDSFREQVRYTGHRDNAEVGLIYFGARYYAPQLGRWTSPDPLTVHGLQGDANPYAFVGGSPMRLVDPFGLDGAEGSGNGSSTTSDNPTQGGGGNGRDWLQTIGCWLGLGSCGSSYQAPSVSSSGWSTTPTPVVPPLSPPDNSAITPTTFVNPSSGWQGPLAPGQAWGPAGADEGDGPAVEMPRPAAPPPPAGGCADYPATAQGACGGLSPPSDADILAEQHPALAWQIHYPERERALALAGSIALTALTASVGPGTVAATESTPPALIQVSRWGRPGLQPGDWVMKGGTTRWNYGWSGKWQPGFGNQYAPYSSGQTFSVPPSTVQWPTGWGPDGWLKGLFGQRLYRP